MNNLKRQLRVNKLFYKQTEVAQLTAQGLSNKEIGLMLDISEQDVKFHLCNIYKKIGLQSRAQLIVWCLLH